MDNVECSVLKATDTLTVPPLQSFVFQLKGNQPEERRSWLGLMGSVLLLTTNWGSGTP